MKRICKRRIQIDALTLCYQVENPYYIEQLCNLSLGEYLDLDEFRLYRIDGRYFDNVYLILTWDGERKVEWGTLKFNLASGNEKNNTHTNGMQKAWIYVANPTLYSTEIFSLTYIEQRIGLAFHNVTSLDLALDTPFNVSRLIKSFIRNKDITTILNGKRVANRKEDRPEIRYTTSGSLDNQCKYLSVVIKQRNAIWDKTKGITLQCYNKAAEISNVSGKEYIIEHYDNPKRLFRTEIHLNSEDIKNYVERRDIEYTPLFLFDEATLEKMFFYFIESVIRFQSDVSDVSWRHILGRS